MISHGPDHPLGGRRLTLRKIRLFRPPLAPINARAVAFAGFLDDVRRARLTSSSFFEYHCYGLFPVYHALEETTHGAPRS